MAARASRRRRRVRRSLDDGRRGTRSTPTSSATSPAPASSRSTTRWPPRRVAPTAGTRCRRRSSSPTSLGSLGIGNDDVVVAYDDRGGAFAGRMVWMLRMIGQPAALLDGGVVRLDRTGRAWARCTPTRSNGEPSRGPPTRIVDADEVAAHIAAGGVVVDSRERARYLGETEPIDRSPATSPARSTCRSPRTSPTACSSRPTVGGALRRAPRRSAGHRLLRIGRHGVPQRARRRGRGIPTSPCLRRFMVGLDRRPRPPRRHRPQPLSAVQPDSSFVTRILVHCHAQIS